MANYPSFYSNLGQSFTMPCYPPPCPPLNCNAIRSISKLANFAHYGGVGRSYDPNCCPPLVLKKRNCCESRQLCKDPPTKRCPPLPPCSTDAYNISNCKDLPAQRLKNVDILEELCYYVPGSDPDGAMDCYTVDCCGNVEKIADGCCCEDDNSGNTLQPVKYSRRQRFSFNETNSMPNPCPEPWPFQECCDNPCGSGNGNLNKESCGRRGTYIISEGPSKSGNPCCGGRKYTYCPEEPIDCSEMLPPESGVYYFDRLRRAFVPEKDLPKAPEVIEKQVIVPDVEEYELLAEEKPEERCLPSVQPVIQPIILPTGGQSCGPCAYPPPPPCYPPPYIPPCDPCNPCNPCNPPCNPCNAPCNPCNPCCKPRSCNPCESSCRPCNPCQCPCAPCPPPCNPCNPCMPCGPMNPFMNMCGGVLPMVIPMCPQQPAGGPGMMMPPPPFPFPPPFSKKKSKKSKSSKYNSSYYNTTQTNETGTEYPDDPSTSTDNIIVPGAPEDLLVELGEDIPPGAFPVDMGNNIEMKGQAEYPKKK